MLPGHTENFYEGVCWSVSNRACGGTLWYLLGASIGERPTHGIGNKSNVQRWIFAKYGVIASYYAHLRITRRSRERHARVDLWNDSRRIHLKPKRIPRISTYEGSTRLCDFASLFTGYKL